jgi:hypothetical protein
MHSFYREHKREKGEQLVLAAHTHREGKAWASHSGTKLRHGANVWDAYEPSTMGGGWGCHTHTHLQGPVQHRCKLFTSAKHAGARKQGVYAGALAGVLLQQLFYNVLQLR